MKLEGMIQMAAPRDSVWAALNDPACLASATPGCKALDEVAPGAYKARLELGIAAIKGAYEGSLVVRDVDAPHSYRLCVEGSGTPGFLNAEVAVALEAEGAGTRLHYAGEAQIGGLIAGVGQRILAGIAKMLIGEFFKKIEAEARRRTG